MGLNVSALRIATCLVLVGCSSSGGNGGSAGGSPAGQGNGGGPAAGGGSSMAGSSTAGAASGGTGNGGASSGGASSGGGSSTGGGGGLATGGSGEQMPSVSLTVSPTVAHVAPGATVQFSAKVTGLADTASTWAVKEGASGGSISATGLYTAPSTTGTFHVVATSHADPSITGTATVISNVVGNCSNLPTSGKWESISPVVATIGDGSGQNFAEGIVVDPFDPATVWLGTGFAGVFKSTDCGATWTHVNTGRNGAAMDNGSHVSIALDPVDKGTMYTVSLFGAWGLWKTTNGGVDWDQLFDNNSEVFKITANAIDAVSMDPTDHKHLVIGMHTNCNAPYAPTCAAETRDGGATWTIVKTPNENWEEGAGPWVLDAKSWLYAGLDLFLTKDSGATWAKVTPSGTWGFSGGEVAVHSIPRAADGTYFLTSSQGIARSSDGYSWSVIPMFTKRVVGFAIGGGRLFASDAWSTSYYMASESNPTAWMTIPAPEGLPPEAGAPYVDYDAAHHVLYSANFAAGLWRLVIP